MHAPRYFEWVYDGSGCIDFFVDDYIKSYKNPEIVDRELVNGTEVDSYYAAYSLPVCEIRQTGDKLLNAEDDEPSILNQ